MTLGNAPTWHPVAGRNRWHEVEVLAIEAEPPALAPGSATSAPEISGDG